MIDSSQKKKFIFLSLVCSVTLLGNPHIGLSNDVATVYTKNYSNLGDIKTSQPIPQGRRVYLLQQALREVLLTLISSDSLGEKKKDFDIWFDKLIKTKYENYLSGWSVVASENAKAEVKFNLAKGLFAEDLKKSGFSQAIESPFVDTFVKAPSMDLPVISIFIDELNNNAVILPAVKSNLEEKTAAEKNSVPMFLWLEPKTITKASDKIDSVNIPYVERPGAYSKAFLSHFKGFKPLPDKTLSQKVADEVNRSLGGLKGKQGLFWPEFGFTSIPDKALILIFSTKASVKVSVLNRVDAHLWQNSKHVRFLWSREMNDPLGRLTASEIIKNSAQKLSQLMVRENLTAKRNEMMKLQFDKSISENSILAIEKQLKTLVLSDAAVLLPESVDDEKILMSFPLSVQKSNTIAKLLTQENPYLNIVQDEKKPALISVQIKPSTPNAQP